MNTTHIVIIAIVIALFLLYLLFYFLLLSRVQKVEGMMIHTFLLKVSKIPALVEVMRGFVANETAFDTIVKLHSSVMIHEYQSIYVLLEHNARIHTEFLFLMKLSMQIPHLQRNEQFLYIREFIILYEKNIKKNFANYNQVVTSWNRFVTIKNLTIIGLLLPGRKKELI